MEEWLIEQLNGSTRWSAMSSQNMEPRPKRDITTKSVLPAFEAHKGQRDPTAEDMFLAKC